MKKLKLIASASLIAATLGNYANAQQDFGYRWIHSTADGRDFAPTYSPYMSAAAADIMSHSSLTLGTSANQTIFPPYSGDVAFEELDLGDNRWMAMANAYNASEQPCSDLIDLTLTGNCSMTVGADFGHIRFNTYYIPNPTVAEREHLIRHEFLHILGIGHTDCNPAVGVMAWSILCSPLYSTLQPTEAALLDSWY